MSDDTIEEMHTDIEIIKRDVANIKSAIFGNEGKLSNWAKKRVEQFIKNRPLSSGNTSQEQMEKEFL